MPSRFGPDSVKHYQPSTQRVDNRSPVVMLYDLNMEEVTAPRLFNLLCLYGDVLRVKFLATKPGCAMVEMGEADAASRAMANLSGAPLFGVPLVLRPSHQRRVLRCSEMGITTARLPATGAPSFEDFSGSPNNRFRTPELAARNRVVAPSKLLRFFNLPVGCGETELMEIFQMVSFIYSRLVLYSSRQKSFCRTRICFSRFTTTTNTVVA